MNAPDTEEPVRRGPEFLTALICSILALFATIFLAICFSAPVAGSSSQRYVFSGVFLFAVGTNMLMATGALLTAVWHRKITIPWWTYPILLVIFCILYLVFLIYCYSRHWGFTIIN
jgi:hypothetical protein